MPSLTGFHIRFTPGWRISLCALIAISILMRLGFWQLQRATIKKHLLSMHKQWATQKPIKWQAGSSLPAHFQPIHVEGHYRPDVVLLDNQHYQHHFGYHVFSPLVMTNNHVVLVDRGWIAGDITRRTLPSVQALTGFRAVEGSVYYPSEKQWVLGPIIEKEQNNLVVIEALELHVVSQFLHKSVYPFTIRLGPQEVGGYVREWPIVSMPPERHDAYALQWFLMAFILAVLFIALNLTVKKKT